MVFTRRKYTGKRRRFLHVLPVAAILLVNMYGYGQDPAPDSLMIFRFLKTDVELEQAGSYFNVLEIKNNDRRVIRGLLRIDGPESWRLIGQSTDTIELQPGATRLFPVRISIPGNTLGGISFVIGAELFGEELYNYANAYVSLKRRSRWEMFIDPGQVYFSEFRPYGEVNISLNNTGNANELLKLSFDMGGLLEFRDEIEADSFIYVDVRAKQDTTINLKIQQKKDISYLEMYTLKSNWRSRSLNIKASTTEKALYGSVRATTLESDITNQLPIHNAPLNAEVNFYNLLSHQRKKMSARVYGKVLFPETQQLNYTLGYYNLYFDPEMNRNIDFYQQLRYMIRYTDLRSMVWLGDRLGLGTLHTLTGRGVKAYHNLNDRNRVLLNMIQNPYGSNIGGFVGYQRTIDEIGLSAGITAETRTDQPDGHFTAHLGGNYRFLQKHSVTIQTATSLSRYSKTGDLQSDTAVLGFAYQLMYRYSDSRLRISAENTNTMFTYLRSSGINRINFSGMYRFRDDLQMKARYYRSDYTSTRYPYNFYHPSNNNINENARVLLSYHQGKLTYQGGPQYSGTIRENYIPSGDYTTRYANFQPGVMGAVSFRLANMRSISPNASFNMMYYSFGRVDPETDAPGFESSWAYTVGINYYDQAFKLNAYYSSGEAADIYRRAVIQDDPQINQAFHIRPYYERYFFKDNVRLSAFLNYSYYMPSMRENLLLNLTGNIYVDHTWNFFTSFNVYRVSRNDAVTGRITSSDVNMMVGVRKAFDIQQPRLAYYDLAIVGFNDLNGDGVKGDDEKPISNVLVSISRDPRKNVERASGFAEVSMITDPTGQITYENIPVGVYDLSIIPLSNLESLYFLHGDQQTIEINADMVHYLPLVESYKIRGKVIIDRDPNSNEGVVSPEGIRVTAVSESGETYSALTNSFGNYVLDLPKASSYEVSIYNVFGENFRLERGRYRVQFTDNRTIGLDFKFTERRRGVRFNEGDQYFQFNLGDDEGDNRP